MFPKANNGYHYTSALGKKKPATFWMLIWVGILTEKYQFIFGLSKRYNKTEESKFHWKFLWYLLNIAIYNKLTQWEILKFREQPTWVMIWNIAKTKAEYNLPNWVWPLQNNDS